MTKIHRDRIFAVMVCCARPCDPTNLTQPANLCARAVSYESHPASIIIFLVDYSNQDSVCVVKYLDGELGI